MLLAMLWILNLARGAGCEDEKWVLTSVLEAVRFGAQMSAQEEQVDRRNNGEGQYEVMALMLRLLGANWKKAEEFAFEGFISIVHLMCRVLIPGGGIRDTHRGSRHLSLFGFILKQPQVADLLAQMLHPDLIEQILQESDRRVKSFPPDSADCIQLLICKTKPFVRGMQRALRFFIDREEGGGNCRRRGTGERCPEEQDEAAWEKAGLVDRMYLFMPSLGEVMENGDRCDQRYPNCIY